MSKIKEEKMIDIQLQQERNSAMERKRKHLLKVVRNKEEVLKQSVKNKIGEEEARRAMQQKEVQKELELRKAEKDILMEMKRDNLARIKRMQEYQQKETQRKIAMNDARSEEMKKKKAELLGKSLTLTASALLSLINTSVLLTRLSCLITSITTQECTWNKD